MRHTSYGFGVDNSDINSDTVHGVGSSIVYVSPSFMDNIHAIHVEDSNCFQDGNTDVRNGRGLGMVLAVFYIIFILDTLSIRGV